MKQTLKTYLNPFILLLILSIIGCKEDIIENNPEETTNKQHHVTTKHLTIDHLPHLEGVITGISVNTTSRTANTTFGDLNLSDIIEYINEDGKESYTFKIENSTNIDSALEFENLHLIKLPNDDEYIAFIIKWIPEYEWYKDNNFNFQIQDFKGNQKHYDLDYNLLQENEFINGQLVNSSTSGRSSTTQNAKRDYYLDCDIVVVDLCQDTGDDYCGGTICGYGFDTVCFLANSGSGGGNSGNSGNGDDTSSGDSTGGGGTHISGGSSGSGNTSGSGGYVPGGSGTVVTNPPTMFEMLSHFIELTPEQRLWIGRPENEELAQQLVDYFLLGGDSEFGEVALEALIDGSVEEQNAAIVTLLTSNSDLLYGPYDSNYFDVLDPFVELNLTDPSLVILWQTHFTAQCALLRTENPDWSDIEIYYESFNELMHIGLDLAGMVPVVGIVFDVINGVAYAIEGEGVNAALALGSAIPVAGQWVTTAKYAKMAVTLANSSKKVVLRIYTLTNGYIKFSNRTQLRKILQITDSSIHAHHIIPYSFGVIDEGVGIVVSNAKKLVQLAAKSADAWHINDILNGIPMPNNLHLTGHSAYTNAIENKLIDLYDNFLSSPDDYQGAYLLLSDFVSALKNKIIQNPTWNSGQYVDFITTYTP